MHSYKHHILSRVHNYKHEVCFALSRPMSTQHPVNSNIFLETCLTHWGRITNICVFYVTIIASDNGLSPGRCQTIIWINAGILLIGALGTNFYEIQICPFKKSTWKRDLRNSVHFSRPQFINTENSLLLPQCVLCHWGGHPIHSSHYPAEVRKWQMRTYIRIKPVSGPVRPGSHGYRGC